MTSSQSAIEAASPEAAAVRAGPGRAARKSWARRRASTSRPLQSVAASLASMRPKLLSRAGGRQSQSYQIRVLRFAKGAALAVF